MLREVITIGVGFVDPFWVTYEERSTTHLHDLMLRRLITRNLDEIGIDGPLRVNLVLALHLDGLEADFLFIGHGVNLWFLFKAILRVVMRDALKDAFPFK